MFVETVPFIKYPLASQKHITFHLQNIYGQQRPVTSQFLYLILVLQPTFQENSIYSVHHMLTSVRVEVADLMQCSQFNVVSCKLYKLLEIGWTFSLGIFLQTVGLIVLVLCTNCSSL